MADAYEVVHYQKIDDLIPLFCLSHHSDQASVAGKSHCDYFEGYLSALNAKTIVVEKNYVDRDYLADYSAYYVRCLTPYSRICTRLHFFSAPFDEAGFASVLSGTESPISVSDLQSSYLGFVVVKPLPQTVIGRTCLRHYPDDNGRRYYPCTRTYKAHLFGIELPITTLAFQEQDHEVAACATSALWSIFQFTGNHFHHPILSPVEITQAATLGIPFRSRTIPNNGLDPEQMANAIRKVGLEPNYIAVNDADVFASTMYAYLRGRVPIILGFAFKDRFGSPSHELHAVGVTGYSLGKSTPCQCGRFGLLTVSSRIDKLYAHDDQIGPFARMELKSLTSPDILADGTRVNHALETSWPHSGGIHGALAFPTIALVPLYHKVRIPFETVNDGIGLFDLLLRATHCPVSPLVWDVHLITVSDLKEEILQSVLKPELKHEILTKAMPRYIWRATAYADNSPALALLFDATEIAQASLAISSVPFRNDLLAHIRAISESSALKNEIRPALMHTTESGPATFVLKLLESFTPV